MSRLITFRQYYSNAETRLLTWEQNNGDLHSIYTNGDVAVFQNGNKLVEGVHYVVNKNTPSLDTVTIYEQTHFTGANYEVIAIKTI